MVKILKSLNENQEYDKDGCPSPTVQYCNGSPSQCNKKHKKDIKLVKINCPYLQVVYFLPKQLQEDL